MALPPEFTSLYRLFLRATSATVLHSGPAVRGLRRLYRPSFQAAALTIKRLKRPGSDPKEVEMLKGWLTVFDNRVNNTLSFFHTSALTRGLSHRVVYNLSFLHRSHHLWSDLLLKNKIRAWRPQLPRRSAEYDPELANQIKLAKPNKEVEKRNASMWGGLGEVIRLAQGRDGLIMGKVRYKRQKFRKPR